MTVVNVILKSWTHPWTPGQTDAGGPGLETSPAVSAWCDEAGTSPPGPPTVPETVAVLIAILGDAIRLGG